MFTLHNGDCLEVLPSIPSGSIDAIITDLPYGTTACKWDTVIEFVPMWKEVKRVLKSNGAFITTASQPFTSALVMSNPQAFKYEIIWKKSIPSSFLGARKRPPCIHENILIFGNYTTYNFSTVKKEKRNIRKGEYTKIPNGKEGSQFGDNLKATYNSRRVIPTDEKYVDTVIFIKSVGNNNKARVHPTQKPVALYEYLIKTYINEGETVLDIAMGSGTTIEAAERTGRNSIGIEKDEGIFQSAVLRLKSYTPSNTASTRQGQVAPQFDNFE